MNCSEYCGARRSWLLIIGFVCLSLSVCAWSAEPSHLSEDKNLEADILLGAARNAILLGDLKTGLSRFHEFRELYPDREDGRREYANALFSAGQPTEAIPEYEYLLHRHPNDPELIRMLVDALQGVGDHPRAKQRLVEALDRFPDRLDFALSLALLYALDDETADADQVIRKYIAGRPLTNNRMRIEAASVYVQLRRPKEAGPIIDELLKNDPDNAKVLALAVRYSLLINNQKEALRLADKLDRLYPGNVDLRLELASSLYAAGNYAEAGRLFTESVERSPNNQTALLGCARVALRNYQVALADDYLERVPYETRGRQWRLAVAERDTITGNYLRAHQMLNSLLEENPNDLRASMALADLDRASDEFIKADARYRADGATANNTTGTQHFAMSLFLQHRYCEAEQACQELLSVAPSDTDTMMLLARILIRTNRYQEAICWVKKAQQISSSGSAECLYFAAFVSPEFEPCTVEPTRPIYLATTLFDLAMADGHRTWARQILDEAFQADPCNIVLKTRLAEWYASFGLPNEACTAAKIYKELLAEEPSNQKWLLGLARANVTTRCYDQALTLYRQLCCESPGNYLYARETARVVFFVCGSPKGLTEYESTLCDWPGMHEEWCRLSQECYAKSTHYSSPSIAANQYQWLLSKEPYEQHVAFELGQVYGMLGNTSDAICTYSYLLSVNPNHRDARVALEGKKLERCRQLLYDHRFVRERGRDGLTSIDRLGEYVGYQLPRIDENEHLSIGYGRLTLAPTYGPGTGGNALTVKYQKQCHGDFGQRLSPYTPLAIFVDCEVQQFDRFVSTRPMFEAGVKIHTWDDLVCTVSATMENVLENGEVLQQDIYRGGLRLDFDYMPNNNWETELTYELQGYSDVNTRQAVEFRNRLQLMPDPRRLTLLADCYYWNFADGSVFSPGPDPFFDMLHPYWTPRGFVMGGVGLEWKQWLSWDRFDGAQHCWVSFSAMKRWDNQDKNYTIYRGMMGWDITRCLSGYAMGEYDDSSPYHGTWAYGGLALKF